MGHISKWKKIFTGVFLVLCVLLFVPDQVQAAGAGNVYAIVICGNNSHKSKAKKIYSALKDNKLPRYKTSDENIHFLSFDATSSKKCITNEKFMNAIDKAFSKSTSKDLNIIYYTGHSSKKGILTYGIQKIGSVNTKTEVKYKKLASQLAKYKGNFVYMANTCHARAFYTEGVEHLKKAAGRFLCLSAVYQDTLSVTNIFTNRILKGIGNGLFQSYPADQNKNGMITAGELYNYIYKKAVKDKPYLDGSGPGEAAVIFQFAYTKQQKANLKLDVGERRQLTAKVYRDGGVLRDIKWKSNNTSVATVDHKGNVVARKQGTVKITSYLTDAFGEVCVGSESVCKIEISNITNKNYVGTYSYNGQKPTAQTGWFEVIITKINSNGKMQFQVQKGTVNGTKLSFTPIITVSINGKIAKFKWEDSWGSNGTGKIEILKGGKKIKLTLKEKTSNSSMLTCKKQIFEKISEKTNVIDDGF